MADPVRGPILMAVAEREGLSVGDIADRIDQPARRVRYHLERLVEDGLVAVAHEERRRGVRVRLFRAERLPMVRTGMDPAVPGEQAHRIAVEVLKLLVADASIALRAGTFGCGEPHFESRVRYPLDRQGCKELGEIYERTLDEVLATMAASAARTVSGEEDPVEVVAGMLIFQVPAARRQGPEKDPE